MWNRILRGWLMLGILVLGGCDSDDQAVPEPFIQNQDYVRLEKGLSLTYRVDSIVYNDFNNSIDTSSFVVKQEVKEKLTDSADIERYLIKQVTKSFKSGRLLGSVLYTMRLSQEEYQIFRNNQRELALKFPLKANSSWDGNLYNNLDSQEYMVKNIHQSATVLGKRYDSTLLIREQLSENLISLDAESTRYAKGIGRIYQKKTNLRFRGDSIPPEDVPWEEKANTGQIVRHRLMKLQKGL